MNSPLNCLNCNKQFLPVKRQKFCCKNCKIKYHSKKRRKYKNIEIKECPICKNKFELPKFGHIKIYCSKKCKKKGVRYKNYQHSLDMERKRTENNIERVRKLAKALYWKNKDKINSQKRERNKKEIYKIKQKSRNLTKKIIKNNEDLRKMIFNFINCCKTCGSIENLEIHHEIYPIEEEQVRQMIGDKKIYYLCKKCHNKLSRKII